MHIIGYINMLQKGSLKQPEEITDCCDRYETSNPEQEIRL